VRCGDQQLGEGGVRGGFGGGVGVERGLVAVEDRRDGALDFGLQQRGAAGGVVVARGQMFGGMSLASGWLAGSSRPTCQNSFRSTDAAPLAASTPNGVRPRAPPVPG